MKSYLVAAIGFLLVGCTTTESLGSKSTNYNQALDYSRNVTALSNAVRASKRMPMTYSRMGSMTYTGSIETSPKVALGLGGDDDDIFEVGIKGTDGGSVVFDALLGEEFYKSVLTSIDPGTIALYRAQGWPDRLLFTALIEHIEIDAGTYHKPIRKTPAQIDLEKLSGKRDANGAPVSQDLGCKDGNPNIPEHPYTASCIEEPLAKAILGNAYSQFEAINDSCKAQNISSTDDCFVSWLSEDGHIVLDNDPDNPRRFLMFLAMVDYVKDTYHIQLKQNAGDSRFPKKFCDKDKTGIKSLDEDELSTAACKRLADYDYAYSLADAPRLDPSGLSADYRIEGAKVFRKLSPRPPAVEFTHKIDGYKPLRGCVNANAESTDGSCKIRIVLRSPNSILYYFGELLRAQTAANTGSGELKKSKNDKSAAPTSYRQLCAIGFPFMDDEAKVVIQEGDFSFGYGKPCAKTSDIRRDNSSTQSMFALRKEQNYSGLSDVRRLGELYSFEIFGERYWVPENSNERGRTMQYITLFNEIFALNQKASDAPSITILQGASSR